MKTIVIEIEVPNEDEHSWANIANVLSGFNVTRYEWKKRRVTPAVKDEDPTQTAARRVITRSGRWQDFE